MAYSLIWLPGVLRAAGLKVAEQPGWADRGRAEMGTVKGVMCHHTVGARTGNMPSLGGLTNGVWQTRRDGTRVFLPGPLAQIGLGRDGTCYVIAAGRCNHAGEGNWKGQTNGNGNFIGVEAENMGTSADPWPEVQLDAYVRLAAAILKHVGQPSSMCCGHREYALPAGRKTDPHTIDMDGFRAKVAAVMAGTGAIRPLVPAVDATGRPTLLRGSRGDLVKKVQKLVGAVEDGIFGPGTEAAVRKFQTDNPPLVADGRVGPETWKVVDKLS